MGLFKTLTRHNFFRLDSNQKSLLEERLLTINTLANLPNNLLLMRLLMVAELGLEPRTRVYEARKLPLLYPAILLAVPYSI